MVTAESGSRYRSFFVGTTVLLAGFSIAATAGCCQPCETGYADQGKTQVQFFSPKGATVTVRACCNTRSHQIGDYAPFENRLELSPEEYSVFNLAPGRYEFKYVSAEGLPGVSIYGELDVKHANTAKAQVFQRRSFVPVSLPSSYYSHVAPVGDEIFPWRGEALRTSIDELDLQRLEQGDVIEKVFVVADLEDAQKRLQRDEVDLAVAERELQYRETRFKDAFFDFRMDAADPLSNFLGSDRKFIEWEGKRQRQLQRIELLKAKIERNRALLKGDQVVIRKGMLVVATQQIVKPYRDVEEASDRIGEILVVMRLGGRHMHWGNPPGELANYGH